MRITVIPILGAAPAEDPGLPAPPGAVGGPSLCFGAVGPGPLVVEWRVWRAPALLGRRLVERSRALRRAARRRHARARLGPQRLRGLRFL